MTRYRICDTEFASNDLLFQAALEAAYKSHVRPLCLCCEPGLPMYIAHLEKAYVIKRMPDSGASHGPGCESYEAPPGLSGRGEVDGQAIEHDAEGTVNLKFAFSLRHNSPAEMDNEAIGKVTASSSGTRLTLRALLHYLWEEAKLSHWQPGVNDQRTWLSVRQSLLDAAVSKETKSSPLADILYIPEMYDEDSKHDIMNRRTQSLAPIMGPGKSGKKLMLLVGEVDSIGEATFGYALKVKNLPDFPLVMTSDLHKSFEKVFKSTVTLGGYVPNAHSIVIATFVIDLSGIPAVQEMCIMLTSPEWIPIENSFDGQLVEMLVEQKRSFQKQLRYNLPTEKPIASVVLTDSYNAPLAMYIDVKDLVSKWATTVALNELIASSAVNTWIWVPSTGTQPTLPLKSSAAPATAQPGDKTPPAPPAAAPAAPPAAVTLAARPPEGIVPRAFQPKRRGNVTPIKECAAMPLPIKSPLAPVTPISDQPRNLIPFKEGWDPGQ